MNKRKTGIAVVVVLAALLILLNRKDVMLTGHHIFLKPLGGKGYETQLQLTFYNGNLLSSTINNIKLRVYINGVLVGEIDNPLEQGIAGGKESVFPIGVRFAAGDLPVPVQVALVNGDKVEVGIKGQVTFSKMVSGGKINLDRKDSVHVSK